MKGVITKIATLCVISLFNAQAVLATSSNDLILLNNLHKELSFRVYGAEGNHCSTEFGILKSQSYNKISQKQLVKACPNYLDSCRAYVYLSNNCTGEVIAYLTFSDYEGIQSLIAHEVTEGTPDIQNGNNYIIFRGFRKF